MISRKETFNFSVWEWKEERVLQHMLQKYPTDSVLSLKKIFGNAGEGIQARYSTFNV